MGGNIKMYFRKIGRGDINGIQVEQDRVKLQDSVNTVMKFRVL